MVPQGAVSSQSKSTEKIKKSRQERDEPQEETASHTQIEEETAESNWVREQGVSPQAWKLIKMSRWREQFEIMSPEKLEKLILDVSLEYMADDSIRRLALKAFREKTAAVVRGHIS
jgi:hypothetical protein